MKFILIAHNSLIYRSLTWLPVVLLVNIITFLFLNSSILVPIFVLCLSIISIVNDCRFTLKLFKLYHNAYNFTFTYHQHHSVLLIDGGLYDSDCHLFNHLIYSYHWLNCHLCKIR